MKGAFVAATALVAFLPDAFALRLPAVSSDVKRAPVRRDVPFSMYKGYGSRHRASSKSQAQSSQLKDDDDILVSLSSVNRCFYGADPS
jgi:hypothetical protein